MAKIPFKTAFGERGRYVLVNTEPSMTHQSFQHESNINNIMAKYARTGMIDHVNKYEGRYADFSTVSDYQSALSTVFAAKEAFDSLPSKVRSRFANDPAQFLDFVADPNNVEEMISLGLASARVDVIPPEIRTEE